MNRINNNGGVSTLWLTLLLVVMLSYYNVHIVHGQRDTICPKQELILPCRCSQKGSEIQIWCSHSDLPRVLAGIKSVAKAINRPIDELILENNFLPSLPGRAFAQLQITRLMLRHNGLERLSSGWLNDMENNLVEIFIVERGLRSIPVDSLFGLRNLEAITIQSEGLKRSPVFSGLSKLRYINIESGSLIELSPMGFRDLTNLESITITGSPGLQRLEAGLFIDLPKLKNLNLQRNGIEWIHLRAFTSGLNALKTIDLSYNKISNAGLVGRAIKDIQNVEILNLDHNRVELLLEASFVDLPSLKELRLNDNLITEIHHGAFHRVPALKMVHLENNLLRHVHPESFLMSSGKGLEIIHLQHNDIGRIEELRSLLDALPMLRFMDLSYNKLTEIPFGALRGHGTLEQLHLNHNNIRIIERDALMAMPSLRELRLKNNSLSDLLPMPFWNLPALKGLDLSFNKFRRMESIMLVGLPSLRRFDISENALSLIDKNSFTKTPMLETVNISSNELTSVDRNTFSHLSNLFELDVSDNILTEMITGLPRAIERINIKNNKIKTLPATLTSNAFDLPNLRMIDLSSNGLTRVNQVFGRTPQMRVISLAKNNIQSIDETSFQGLNRLEVLNLQDNQINTMHDQSTAAIGSLMELNLQGNRLEVLVDKILENIPNLEKLDISRNNIVEIMPNSFRKSRSLQILDLSSNSLRQLPTSLENLANLKDIDLSFNEITNLTPEIMKLWTSLEEFRASNNKIGGLQTGTFKNLPLLQYLDLSSNDLSVLERGSIRNLPELQEIVLADNRLVELRERIFEDLPNLQALHLQQNNLRIISPNTFYNSPSILYLNLSTNQFRHMENINLRNARNLEVLDLSNNEIRRVSANPLRGLDWLVELKLNDNRICNIQGEPFVSMPRLRVLNLRNNRMGRLHESNFRNLRSNIAILDVDGNPFECSCEMMWLRAWLQETKSQAGPICRDGTMLRDLDLNRQSCNPTPPADDRQLNQIPLTNEHGDLFSRQNDNDDCGKLGGEGYEDFPPNQNYFNSNNNNNNNLQPSPGESEYFYDQYVDFPNNDTQMRANITQLERYNQTSPFVNFDQNKFTQHAQNQFPSRPGQPSSQFTFFGMPIPSLSLGNIWGAGRTANNRATSAESGTRGKGRVQIYRPGDPELQVIINRGVNDIDALDNKNREPAASERYPAASERYPAASERYPTVDNSHDMSGSNGYKNIYSNFQTPFNEPKAEKGGFAPMIPGVSIGGFTPINDPSMDNKTKEIWLKNDEKFKEKIPLLTNSYEPKRPAKYPPPSPTTYSPSSTYSPHSTYSPPTTVKRNEQQQKLNHLTTSISPILSTLAPNGDINYDNINVGDYSNNAEVMSDILVAMDMEKNNPKFESESRNSNKMDPMSFEGEAYQDQFSTPSKIDGGSKEEIDAYEDYPVTSEIEQSQTAPPPPPPFPIGKKIEQQDNFPEPPLAPTFTQPKFFDQHSTNQSGSSSLSALVAPGGVINSQEVQVKNTPVGKSTITKVFSPSPPLSSSNKNDQEIAKLITPFYPQQHSSDFPDANAFDSEYQPNQFFQQTTLNDNEKTLGKPQYEREDMDWYFSNYNQSAPILNYNLQPENDNYNHYNKAYSLNSSTHLVLIHLIVIKFFHFLLN